MKYVKPSIKMVAMTEKDPILAGSDTSLSIDATQSISNDKALSKEALPIEETPMTHMKSLWED